MVYTNLGHPAFGECVTQSDVLDFHERVVYVRVTYISRLFVGTPTDTAAIVVVGCIGRIRICAHVSFRS